MVAGVQQLFYEWWLSVLALNYNTRYYEPSWVLPSKLLLLANINPFELTHRTNTLPYPWVRRHHWTEHMFPAPSVNIPYNLKR